MKMKIMLEDVVKKDYMRVLQEEILIVKNENIKLRKEICDIKNKLQFFDQKFRRNNIVVSGLKSRNITEANQSLIGMQTIHRCFQNIDVFVKNIDVYIDVS